MEENSNESASEEEKEEKPAPIPVNPLAYRKMPTQIEGKVLQSNATVLNGIIKEESQNSFGS